MRVMMMHKTDQNNEADALPGPEIVTRMGQLCGEMMSAGVMLAGEGLRSTRHGVRLMFSKGQRAITKGPYTGSNEVLAAFQIVRVHSIDEAIEWASRLAQIIGDVEIDIRPVMEPWDLGICPKPEGDATTRFMIARKADKTFEAGVQPAPKVLAEMAALIEEMTKAGALLTAERLQPSSQGVRLNYSEGNATVTDGPFTESKELIAGYSILQVRSTHEAIAWTSRFVDVIGDVEIDIRPLCDSSDVG